MKPKADVLIVTVTKVESQTVMKVFQEATGKQPRPERIGDRAYHDLGEVNGARVFMALSEMGAEGLGASQQVVQKGIAALRPSVVILVRMAFGVNKNKQAIGDILVSTQLWLYELQRVGKKKIIPRGSKPDASGWLLNHLKNADLHWEGAKVRFGLVLTGEKLVDNVDYRKQLKKFEPEAIGGEMEGAGLYVTCQDAKVDWILVKAISDWADGNKGGPNKDAHQAIASQNSAGFVLHAFQYAPFESEPVGKGIEDRGNGVSHPVGSAMHTIQRDVWQEGETNVVASSVTAEQIGGTRIVHPEKVVIEATSIVPFLHQLPSPPADFTGREKELDELQEDIQNGATISGLRGMGGIGKTALGMKLAEQLAKDYPDAQIFINLHGASDQQPLKPGQVMTHVIRSFLPEAKLPDEEGELAGLYRSVLHGQRALLFFDNARDEKQVLPLLPPQGCLTLVTSRQHFTLPGLRALNLETLAPREARALVRRIAGRVKAEEADAIARQCGYLPLALRLATSILNRRLDWTPGK